METSSLKFLNCVHSLLIENEDFADFPYSQVGTGFLVLYHGGLTLVSAKHCFENHRVKGDQVRICHPGRTDGTFLTFDLISRTLPSKPTDDTDFSDIVLMRIKEGTVDLGEVASGAIPVFPIASHLVVAPDHGNVQEFILRGYPLDMNGIDYEGKRIPRRSLTVSARYQSQDASQHVYVLEVDDYADHSDGNGMSGGPAIALVKFGQSIRAKLAGITIRGFHGSRIARIIDARVLLRALDQLAGSTVKPR